MKGATLLTRACRAVPSATRRAAHPSGYARCSAGAGCSATKHQSLSGQFPPAAAKHAQPHNAFRVLSKSLTPQGPSRVIQKSIQSEFWGSPGHFSPSVDTSLLLGSLRPRRRSTRSPTRRSTCSARRKRGRGRARLRPRLRRYPCTSHIRNRLLLGPYSRDMRRPLWWS